MKNGKKALTAVLGVIVVLIAAWLGVDLSSTPQSLSTSPTTTSAARAAISDLPACSLTELPNQADDVISDIFSNGPFEYPDNDGVRFGNYEGVLPDQERNYYREYTVESPGLNHRGPLRIVTGGTEETDPDVWYYTSDHYDSFCEITDIVDITTANAPE